MINKIENRDKSERYKHRKYVFLGSWLSYHLQLKIVLKLLTL